MAGKKKAKAASGETVEQAGGAATLVETHDVAGQFIGQWNRLVSTTNWEKGRIICHWRDALVAAGSPVVAYSDEAWSQLVGGVTSQHVGRLRRVFTRFGDAYDQYEGLFWSHFQAAIDWEDAEMWLEGAIRNGWSVSQMRGKRWETLGLPGAPPAEDAVGEESASDDAVDAADDAEAAAFRESFEGEAKTASESRSGKGSAASEEDEEVDSAEEDEAPFNDDRSAAPAKSRSRLSVDVDELPTDIADAFEQFKLAIIAQRRLGWSETTPQAVIECLDALKELALAPSDD